MSLAKVLGSRQSDFEARSGGSCWGISFVFCMTALQLENPVAALEVMLKAKKMIASKVETLMGTQSKVLSGLGSKYSRNSEGIPFSDVGETEGLLNQGMAIQGRHDFVKQEAAEYGNRCIGTLSSFFEGGTGPLIQRVLQLGTRAGLAAGHIGLQGKGSHSVAVFWSDGFSTPYFFDPNYGLFQGDSSALPADLEKELASYTFIYAHVYKKLR